MIEKWILAVSVFLQFIAALLAVRLIWITKHRTTWLLIAAAILLMAARRSITLYKSIANGTTPDPAAETVALITSTLMLAGIILIAPMFRSIKKIEQAARESEDRYRAITEDSPALICRLAPDLKITYANNAYCKCFGKTLEQLIGADLTSVVPEADREMIIADIRSLTPQSPTKTHEYKVAIPNNPTVWQQWTTRAIFDDRGKIVAYQAVGEDISERKLAEEALRESEDRLRLKLDSILMPEADILDQELSNIIDAEVIQSMMENFTKLTGIGTAILDIKGNILVATGWQDICTKFHRVHPEAARYCTESDLYLAKHIKPGEYVAYKCKHNLWDVATPLYMGDKHVGNIYTGQFFYDDEVIDTDFFAAQAEKYGFDKNAYLDALKRVPRFSRDEIKTFMNFLTEFSTFVSRLSFSNIKLARAMAEQKKAQEYLQAMDLMVSSSSDMMALLDKNYIYLAVNNAYLEAFGRTREQMIGHHISEFFPKDVFEKLIAPYSQRALAGEAVHYQAWRDFASLGRRLVDVLYSPYIGENKEIKGFVVCARDITDRKFTEQVLEETENRLQLTIASANLGTWDWHIPTGKAVFNKRWAEMIGYALDELKPSFETWQKFVHPDDLKRITKQLDAHLRGETSFYQNEFRMKTKDGKWRWIMAAGSVIERDKAGKPLRMTGIHQDITDRKEAEDVLKKQEEILNQTGTMAKIGGWEHDLVTRKAFWTRALYDIIEIDPQNPPPGPDEHLSYYPEKEREMLRESYQKSIETGEPFDLELLVRTAKGRPLWCRAMGMPIYDDTGRCIKMRGTFQDITERKTAEIELAKHRQHLEELVEQRTAELKRTVNLMAGREVRMAELKKNIYKLREQLTGAGIRPIVEEETKDGKDPDIKPDDE